MPDPRPTDGRTAARADADLDDADLDDADLDDAGLAELLVTGAGGLAARMRSAGVVGEEKTSVSDVVTAADRAAEAYVVETLRRLRPDDGILGEEGTDQPSRSGRVWVVDPVDGTYNFLSGLPYWCSGLALRDGDDLLLGAVHQPTANETWLASAGSRTTLGGRPVAELADEPLERLSLATYIHPTTLDDPDVREPFLSLVAGCATPRVLGSGLADLAAVAGGRLGAWAQHSCPPWDWLPGRALVEGAGGRTAVVEHRNHRWHLAGGARAVADLQERLLST